MRLLVILLAVAAAGYLAACSLLFFLQRSLIYYPQPRLVGGPSTILRLPMEGGEVLVSVRPHDGADALLYFGGNAEDVSMSLPEFSDAFPDRALYLLHYRGYGGSSGTPTEEALQSDALALFDKVHAEHPDIVILGRSLGAGVAVRLASQRPASRLILITPFDSLAEVAAEAFPYFPARWLLSDKYESWRYASRVTAPTLIVAAEHDEIIPRRRTEQLYAHFPQGVATLKVIPGTGHNTISGSPLYLEILKSAVTSRI